LTTVTSLIIFRPRKSAFNSCRVIRGRDEIDRCACNKRTDQGLRRFLSTSPVLSRGPPGRGLRAAGAQWIGQTTTLRLLLGLLHPTSGQATIFGLDCWRQSLQVRRLVSYLPGELRMYDSMSGLALLRFLSDLREGDGLDRAVALAEQVMQLNLRKKVRAYSTGMKQKLALALAFSDPVDVLILDEPTSALDPSARGDVLRLVREARSLGQTVIFSGHVLSEVEA